MAFRKETPEEWAESRRQAQVEGGPGATVSLGSTGTGEDAGTSVPGSPMIRPGYARSEPLGQAGWHPSDVRAAGEAMELVPRMDMRPISAPGALPAAPGAAPKLPQIGRPTTRPATRGHNAASALAAEVDRHVAMFGRVIHPAPATVAVERRAGRMENIGLGTDIQPRDKTGMQAKQQIAAIATPGGLKGDTSPGAIGRMAGKPEDAITAAGLVEERLPATERMMKGSEVRPPRAAGVAKFGISEAPSNVTPKIKEKMGLVTVSKGEAKVVDGKERLVPKGKKTTMTNAEHAKRAEKQIAKRKQAEGGY